MDSEGIGQRHGGSGQYRVDDVERPGHEHERVLERLGDSGDERSQAGGQHDSADDLLLRRLGVAVDRECRSGKGEHHDREESGHEHSGGRVAGEEPVQIAADQLTACILVVPHQEPDDGVQNVVQPGGNEHAVGEAVDSAAHHAVVGDGVAHPLESAVEEWVHERHDHGDDETGDRRHDRHQTTAAEEAEIVRQLLAIETLPENCREQSDDDACQHAVVDHGRVTVGIDLSVEHDRRHCREDAVHHHVADHRCERRRTIGLLGPADGDTDREDEGKPGENRLTGGGDDRSSGLQCAESPQQVVLTEPQENSGGRQNSDRQHEAATEPLQPGQ